MTFTHSPDVEKIISRLKTRHETKIKGIISDEENKRMLETMQELLQGCELSEDEIELFDRYLQLDRCFTVAEANRIAAIHGRVKFKRARVEKRRQ